MNNTLDTNNFNQRSITVLTIIFMMWGFITVANGALLGELKDAMHMSKPQQRLLSYIFYLVYFVMAMPAAWIVEKVGFKKGVFYGLVLSACCSVFMVLAVRELSYNNGDGMGLSYYEVLTGVIILGCGVTLLQVAANPYVMFLGDKGNEASSLLKTQAFNAIGTWLAPLIGVMVVAYEPHIDVNIGDSIADIASFEMLDKAERVVLPYILFSVILAGLAIRLNFSSLPEIKVTNELGLTEDKGDSIFNYRHVILGAFAIFFYVAAEVAIGSNLADYIKHGLRLTEFDGMEKYLVAYYWGSAMVGRFVGGQLLEGKSANKAIVIASCGGLFLLAMSLLNTGILSMTSILFIGLFNSILFPAIFAISVKGMGKLAAKASGLLNMAIIGGAIGTLIVNEILDVLNYTSLIGAGEPANYNGFPIIKIAMLIAIPCYLYLIYFGAYGFRNKVKKVA